MAERINPDLTMLSMEELDRMEDLSGHILYASEAKRIPRMPMEEEKVYIEKARTGDKEAKDVVMMVCLNWSLMRGFDLHQRLEPRHLDPMDLVGAGYVAMAEKLDHALTLEEPIAYLMTVSSWTMQNEALFKDSLIHRPKMSREVQAQRDPFPVTDVSLEKESRYGQALKDVLAAPVEVREVSKDYTPLYQAVNQLSPTQRRTVIDGYGLFGHPALPTEEIARREKRTKHNISSTLHKARRSLAKKL